MSAREVAADASRVAGEGTAADAVATTDSPAPAVTPLTSLLGGDLSGGQVCDADGNCS